MAVRAMIAERELDKQFIEREGNVYLERIEAERASKQQHHSSEQ